MFIDFWTCITIIYYFIYGTNVFAYTFIFTTLKKRKKKEREILAVAFTISKKM